MAVKLLFYHISAFPGYSMVSILVKNIKIKMILLHVSRVCKLSIRLRNIFIFVLCAHFDQHNIPGY